MDSRTNTLSTVQSLEVAFFKALISSVGLLPLPMRASLGRAFGVLCATLPHRERRIAELQLKKFLPERASRKTLLAVYSSLGQALLESFNLDPFADDIDSYVKCADEQPLHRALERGKGVIALTAHTANWELFALWTKLKGAKILPAGKQARSPVLQVLLSEMRERAHIETLWRADMASGRRILKALKHNCLVAALIDQDTNIAGEMVPFFGQPAYTPTGLIDLAKRADSSILTAFLLRTGHCSFEAHVEEIDSRLSTYEIALEYNRRLEKHIRQSPSQWVWFHKRWRTLEDGTRLSTKNYIAHLSEDTESA